MAARQMHLRANSMKRLGLTVLCLSFLLSLGGFPFLSAGAQEPKKAQVNDEPADASEVRQQIASVEKRLPQLPDRGAGLYFLASSKQHVGETREALRLLKECLALHEGFDPAGSPELGVLKGSKEFDDMVAGVHREFPAVSQSRIAFVTEEKDLVPEGLAYDSRQDVLYLSSLNRKKIVKVTADGKAADFVPAGRDNLLPILGIRADHGDGSVWANSWDENGDRSELLHFDAAGRLLGRYAPKDAAKHGFNDLVVRKAGQVILTDSVSNQVLRFDQREHTFTPLQVSRALSAPNGIALDDDDRQLFVADDFGVVRVDLTSGAIAEVNPGLRNTLAGIDGLYWHKGSLVAVQNAIGSPRVAEFLLSKDGMQVTKTTVLENRSPFTVLPTTGAIRDNDFYFIVNSQSDNMNGDHIMDVTKLQPVRIAVLRLH
jgi:hypothetical protein